jgi:hypothetical protein
MSKPWFELKLEDLDTQEDLDNALEDAHNDGFNLGFDSGEEEGYNDGFHSELKEEPGASALDLERERIISHISASMGYLAESDGDLQYFEGLNEALTIVKNEKRES